MIRPRDTILFQGDSITNAVRRPEEINNAFQLGAGYALLIAARLLLERPADQLTFLNRGVSGDNVQKLADRWRADCLELRPTVLSILVGINDTMAGTPLAEFTATYRELLQTTRRELPAVRLVLCEPYALPCGLMTPAHCADLKFRQAAVRQLAAEFAATFVPLQAPFHAAAARTRPEDWAYDGVHATAAGFALIAREWLAQVERM